MIVRYVGVMSINRWMNFWQWVDARVLLDGVDITSRCRWFDDEQGVAECLVLAENGQAQMDPEYYGASLTELVRGRVEVHVP